jgi:2'-hydroxyisoflavone reductase
VYGDRALVGRVQFIDVRDLAAWFADACHAGTGGVYNLTGTFLPFGGMLGLCQAAVHGEAELGWIPSERLVAAGVDPGMGIPLWIAEPGCEAINDVDSSRAVAAGLACRPATDTIRDTLAWDTARGGPAPGSEGLPAAEEDRLLAMIDLDAHPASPRSRPTSRSPVKPGIPRLRWQHACR